MHKDFFLNTAYKLSEEKPKFASSVRDINIQITTDAEFKFSVT